MINKLVLPDAKAYIKKRERKNLIEEQMGASLNAKMEAKHQESLEAQYIELKEITRNINRDGDHPEAFGVPEASEEDYSGQLASFTNYTSLEGDISGPNDDANFVDEANNMIPYSQQVRGYG